MFFLWQKFDMETARRMVDGMKDRYAKAISVKEMWFEYIYLFSLFFSGLKTIAQTVQGGTSELGIHSFASNVSPIVPDGLGIIIQEV